MGRWAAFVLVWAVGFGTGLIGQTWGAFSATTANGSNSFQAAASFCTPGSQTVLADADAYVYEQSPTNTYGTAATVQVESRNNRNKRTLVHFVVPPVPSGCTLTYASFRMNASSADTGRTLQAFRAGASWTETGTTWNNQPATTGPSATAPSAVGWVQWNVTAQVQAWYGGSPNDGFLVRDATESDSPAKLQVYSSREGTNDPELALTFG